MVRMSIKKTNKQTQTNNSTNKKLIYWDILNTVNACLGNWDSVTEWFVTVQRVVEVFVARVLATTSNWAGLGLLKPWICSDLICSWAVVLCDLLSTCMIFFLLIDFNYVQNVFKISTCKRLSYVKHFCICTNSFYWLFTRFLFMYNFHQFYSRNGLWQSLAAFSTQEINQHIKHTNGTCWPRCRRSCLGSLWDCLNLTLLLLSPLSQTSLALYVKWGAAKSSRELTTRNTGCMYRHNPDSLLDHRCSLNSVGFLTRLTSKRRMTSSVWTIWNLIQWQSFHEKVFPFLYNIKGSIYNFIL